MVIRSPTVRSSASWLASKRLATCRRRRPANDTEYGLTGSVFTEDVSTAINVSKQLEFGSVNVNTHLALPTEMPWSGFKNSGYGRDLSAYALDDYSRTKHIAIQH